MTPYLRVANVQDARLDLDDVKSMNFTPDERRVFELKSGDVLVNEGQSRELVGRSALYRGEVPGACFQNTLIRFRCFDGVDPEFILIVFRGYQYSGRFSESATQTTNIAHLSTGRLAQIEMPCPPSAEQQRIVARVDELMVLLDRLEAARTSRETTRVAMRDGALAALRDAEDAEAVEIAWARVARRMEELFTDPADVAPLRQTILQLAVRGRLVPQDPSDEPASELLQRIAPARRQALAMWENQREAAATERKLSKLPQPSAPYPKPPGWVVASVLGCTQAVVDCHDKTAPYVSAGVPIVRTSNIRDGRLVWDAMKYVTEATHARWSQRCPPSPGDIIFTREAPMGQAGIVPPGVRVCLGQRTMLIRPMASFVLGDYLLLSLLEPGVLQRAADKCVGMTVKHLRVGDVEKLPVMIPPLAEQHRIVAKVHSLIGLCDELQQRLEAERAARGAFAGATVHHFDG